MYSTTEAELGSLFINSKLATKMWQTLAEMGHPQPLTLFQTDNFTAHGVVTNKNIPKATKAINMCFQWLSDCKQQKQFHFNWWSTKTNYMEYWTKHHLTAHHKLMWHFLITISAIKLQTMQCTPKHQQNDEKDYVHHGNQNWRISIQSSCKGVLESLKSLTQTLGDR